MLSWNAPVDRFLNYSRDLKWICFESWAILLLEGVPLLAECPSQSPSLQKKQKGAESFLSTELEKQHTTEKTSSLWEVLMIRSCRFFEGGPRINTIPGCSPLKPRNLGAIRIHQRKFMWHPPPSGPFKGETTKGSISTDSPHWKSHKGQGTRHRWG